MRGVVNRLLENGDVDDDDFDPKHLIKAQSWIERAITKYGLKMGSDSSYFYGTIPCVPFVKFWHSKPYTVDGIYIHAHTMPFFGGEHDRSFDAQGIWIYMNPVMIDKRWEHAPKHIGKIDYKIKFWSVPFDKAEPLLERTMAIIQNAGQQGYDSFDRIYAKIKSDLRPYKGWGRIKPGKVTADPVEHVLSSDEQHANPAQPDASGVHVPESPDSGGAGDRRERGDQ